MLYFDGCYARPIWTAKNEFSDWMSNPRVATRPPQETAVRTTTIAPEEWQRRLASRVLSRREVNRLLMNYLVVEGYKDAAECFAREAGVAPQGDLGAIAERNGVRAALQAGDVGTAVRRVNDMQPDLLDAQPRVAFRLQQLACLERVRAGDVRGALDVAQEELAPRARARPEFLRDLERTMTLLVLPNMPELVEQAAGAQGGHADEAPDLRALADPGFRVRVANEVNAALLAVASQESESKLPAIVRLMAALQDELSARVSFPRIVDVSSARFDPPLS